MWRNENILKSSNTIGQILKQFITLESGLVDIFLQDLYLRKQKKKKCAWPNYPETATLNILVSFPQKLFCERELFVCLLFIKQVLFFSMNVCSFVIYRKLFQVGKTQ